MLQCSGPSFALIIVIIFSSCNQLSNKEALFYKQLDSTLIISAENIRSSATARMRSLDNKMMQPNPATAEKAKKWYHIAATITQYSNNAFAHLTKLVNELTQHKTYNNKTVSAVNAVFTKEKNEELNLIISGYLDSVLKVNDDLTKSLYHSLPLNKTTETSMNDVAGITALIKLHQLQVNIRLCQNMLVTFCDSKVAYHEDYYDVYSFLGYINSTKFLPGETAEVFVGIGSYNRYAKPKVYVDGYPTERIYEGNFQHNFKVSNKPGDYTTVIKIEYTDPNTGMPASVLKKIKYTVLAPCNDKK